MPKHGQSPARDDGERSAHRRHAGLVEEITLRDIRLRDHDGTVHFVPNGEVKTVVNMSRGYAQSVIDLEKAVGAA
jgi:small-conductance mechanosensitive channel